MTYTNIAPVICLINHVDNILIPDDVMTDTKVTHL